MANTSKTSNSTQKKTETKAEAWKEEAKTVETEAAPTAAKKPRKKGKPRTPISAQLEAAPTAARKAIIIERQLEMIQRRKLSVLELVGPDVLEHVSPGLRS